LLLPHPASTAGTASISENATSFALEPGLASDLGLGLKPIPESNVDDDFDSNALLDATVVSELDSNVNATSSPTMFLDTCPDKGFRTSSSFITDPPLS
jgi:hypothetical protein